MTVDYTRIEVYNENGRWHWRLIDNNAKAIARSNEEGYKTKNAVFKHIGEIKTYMSEAQISIKDR